MARAARESDSRPIDEKYLIRRIQRYVVEGINSEEGDVTEVRQSMFERYYGEPYGNERDGFSKYRSREVLEAVEWGLPALLRVFMGGVKAVEFRASGADDEDQAAHETDVVNYWFYDGNPEYSGFLTLYAWVKDILLYPNGYVTVMVHEEEEDETEYLDGITEQELAALEETTAAEDPDATIYIDEERDEDVQGQPARVFDVSIEKKTLNRTIEVTPRAPDTIIIEHGHAKLDVDSARFSCIREKFTRSELIDEFDYDEADIDDIGSGDDDDTWNSERVVRLFYIEESPDGDSGEYDNPADNEYWRYECYMRVDFDEDGISEQRKIVLIGDKIFENEETDYNPIVAASAIHVTHKHIGLSYAEIVNDLQELTTQLTRQLLDNIYKQNVRRTFINEQAITSDNATMDQLLDAQEEVIELRGNPHENIMPETIQPIVQEIAAVLQLMSDKPQMRTGVAPQLTLDPSVLKESTMGAFVGAMEQASQRLELLARLFAETGLKKVFQKIHYLLRTYFDGVHEVKINKQWVPTRPTRWKKRSNMNVNVGLGFNNKQAMMTLLTTLLSIQKEAVQAGLADPKKIYNTLEKLIEQANMGHVDTFFLDPEAPGWKPPEPQPDAAMISAKAQAGSLAADAKRQDAKLKHDIQMDRIKHKDEGDWKAADAMQELDKLQTDYAKAMAEIAYKDAQITELNHRATGKNHGMEPAEGSAEDEFQRAGERVQGKKPGGNKPASADLDKTLASRQKAKTSGSTGRDQTSIAAKGLSNDNTGRETAAAA